MSPTGYMYFIAIVSISPFKLFQCDLLETDWNKFRIKSFVKYQTWNSTIEKKSVGKIQFDIFWYFLVKPSACELRVAQYEKPITKGFSYWATLSSQVLGLTKKYKKYQTWHSTIGKICWKNSIWYFWYFLVKPSACELRVAQYEKPLTKGHCPIKQRDQNSAKDPDKIAKKRSERRERSHLLKEKIIKLIEGGLQLSEYQARKVKELSFS